jgi:hypothetical protein
MSGTLHELAPEACGAGGPALQRRLFSGPNHLLVVEYDPAPNISHFRLYCGLTSEQRSCLLWDPAHGLRSHRLHAGDDSPLKNLKPLLGQSLPLDHPSLTNLWNQISAPIDPVVRQFVAAQLLSPRS